MKERKQALGRGLGALIDIEPTVQTSGSSSIAEIELSKIEANPSQPRTMFDDEALEELAKSIAEIGIVQPITLREIATDRYQIIAGERRFRASKLAGLDKIPAYIKTVKDESVMQMALVENIQREDLNAIEIALSYQRLLDEGNFTQEELSQKVGKKRATISNYLRLLKLPAEIQLSLVQKKIDMGHARALINVQDPAKVIAIYEQIVSKGLSVRQVEELVRSLDNDNPAKPSKRLEDGELKAMYQQMEEKISSILGISAKISRGNNGKGKIVLQFSSDEEFEHITELLDRLNK